MLLSDNGPPWGGTKRVLERDPEKRAPKDAKRRLKETKTEPSGATWGHGEAKGNQNGAKWIQNRLEPGPERLEAESCSSFLNVYRYIRFNSIVSENFYI